MKGIKVGICMIVCMMTAPYINAQTAGTEAVAVETGMANPSVLAEAKAPVAIKAKEMTLTLRNNCDRHLQVFAGSKKEVFDGRSEELGGRSTNTVYLLEGDVVCIMDAPKTIHACAVIKDGTTKVEINISGNGFVK